MKWILTRLHPIPAFLCMILSPVYSYAESKPAHSVITIGSNQIITDTLHESNQKLQYTYDVIFPQIKGKYLSDAAREFNAAIKNRIQEDILALKKARLGVMNTLKMDYDIAVIKPDDSILISVRFIVKQKTSKDTQPTIFHETINYNLKTGEAKELTFETLFAPESNFQTVLNDYSSKRFHKLRGISNADIQEALTNPPEWNLRPDGLLLTFDNLPAKIGPREILVPYSELKNIVSVYSPIAICVKRPSECAKK